MSDVATTVANKLLLIYSMLDARIFDLSDSVRDAKRCTSVVCSRCQAASVS